LNSTLQNEGSEKRDIVVIGASAGGVEAITALIKDLPSDIPASLFVVSHVLPESSNHLVDALNTIGPLPAKSAEDGEDIRNGVIYVAPPDRHLLVKRDCVRVTRGPRENRWRPAIDPLFRSAAVAYGPRVMGVVLTGMLDDGTAGLLAIKRCGGMALVQDPEEAPFPEMPQTALANVPVDHKLPIRDLAVTLARLVREPAGASVEPPRDVLIEARIAETGYSDETLSAQTGSLSALSCPECGGPLWEGSAGDLPRYRCRVGHAYGERSLLSAQDEVMESAVWAAIRILDQRANVLANMAAKNREAQRTRLVAHHEKLAQEARQHAIALRALLVKAAG
jgi:two-component system, chemotaxis family, protein-glutamate methylesterase/glutaminase